MKTFEKNTDLGILILRVLVAGLLLFHGLGNLTSGYTFIKGMMLQSGLPEFIGYGAFIGEIIAPILLILGFKVRLSALFVATTMLIAILTTHISEIFVLNQFGGWAIELQAFYFFGAIVICFTGSGKYIISK